MKLRSTEAGGANLRIVLLVFITVCVFCLASLKAAGSSDSRSMEAVFTEDLSRIGGDDEFKVLSAQVTDYSGYGRHLDGKLISCPEDLKLSVVIDGSRMRGTLGRLLDHEDWEVRVVVRRSHSYQDDSGQTHTDIRDLTYSFEGTTREDRRCFDGYELSEKLKKYDSVVVSSNITIPEDVGTIILDGKAGGFKRCSPSLKDVSITGQKKGFVVSGKGSIFRINEGISAKFSDLSLVSSDGYCIDNGGSQFSETCDKVIRISGNHDMYPVVDYSKAATGHSKAELSNMKLDSGETAFYNGGEAVLKGDISISGETGVYNMGTLEAERADLLISAEKTGVSNAGWIGIVMDSLRRRDGSYSKEELSVLASSLAGDMTDYIPGSVIFRAGNSGTVINGSDTGINNGGVLEFLGGKITGGRSGVDNNGSFSFKGGSTSGGRFGIYQNGTFLMTGEAQVDPGSVLHLTSGHIVLYDGGPVYSHLARISISDVDRTLGREVIRVTGGGSVLPGVLCQDNGNGIMPQDAPFDLAFETISGHRAALRSGLGEENNGKVGSIYLSALFHAIYKDGLNCPLKDIRVEGQEDTPYFWKEKQTFDTDISLGRTLRIFLNEDDISSSFRQISWHDQDGDHTKKIAKVYDRDHVFTATWDLAIGVTYHGNHDTDNGQQANEGKADFTIMPVSVGDQLFDNIRNNKTFFVREEKKTEDGTDYSQRYSFEGWDMAGHFYKPGYRISGLSFLYDAIREGSITLKKTGSSNRVIVHLDASWDAFPKVRSRTVYLYDNELLNKQKVSDLVLEKGCVYALDREDGVLEGKSISLYTDPADRTFDIEAFCKLGVSGRIRVYYGAADRQGNCTLWPGEVCVMTSDDEDLDITCNHIRGNKTPCGGSSSTEDSSTAYIRYIDKDAIDSLLPASIWKGDYKDDLDQALSREISDGRIYYTASEIREIRSAIEEDRESGKLMGLEVKRYLKVISQRTRRHDNRVNSYSDLEMEEEMQAVPSLSLEISDTGVKGKVSVLFSPVDGAGGYEIQRCRVDAWGRSGEWEKRIFLSGGLLSYCRMDEDMKKPFYVFRESVDNGVYRYRIRAFASLRGKCDETMTSSSWSSEKEIGFVPKVCNVSVKPGIRSAYVSWDPVPGAKGYRVTYHGKDKDEISKRISGGKTETVLAGDMTEGVYSVSVKAYIGWDQLYYSQADTERTVSINDIPIPEVTYSGGRIKWQSVPAAIRYEITKRRVTDGKKEDLPAVSGCSIRVSTDGLYEYRVRAIGERLDGKEIYSESDYILAA